MTGPSVRSRGQPLRCSLSGSSGQPLPLAATLVALLTAAGTWSTGRGATRSCRLGKCLELLILLLPLLAQRLSKMALLRTRITLRTRTLRTRTRSKMALKKIAKTSPPWAAWSAEAIRLPGT